MQSGPNASRYGRKNAQVRKEILEKQIETQKQIIDSHKGLQSVIAQALKPILAKVKSLGDQKQEVDVVKGDITHIATQMQEGFKMLADRTKALGKELATRPGGSSLP